MRRDPRQAHARDLPSYLKESDSNIWRTFLEQVDRVEPHLGPLAKWTDTLRRPRRSLIVDVPVGSGRRPRAAL